MEKYIIDIQINQQEIRRLYLEMLEEKVKEVEKDLLFWDSRELARRTCLSFNTIKKEFFYDPRFPKYKVGGKWMYPAEEKILFTYLVKRTK
jgi:hypothetical protein